jgi:hypothetical protein
MHARVLACLKLSAKRTRPYGDMRRPLFLHKGLDRYLLLPQLQLRAHAPLLSWPLPSPVIRTKHRDRVSRALLRILDQLAHLLESLPRRVPHKFKQHALARRHCAPFPCQPGQGHASFATVAAADAVREDVDFVAGREQVECRLRNADVRFDAHEQDFEREVAWGGGRVGLRKHAGRYFGDDL